MGAGAPGPIVSPCPRFDRHSRPRVWFPVRDRWSPRVPAVSHFLGPASDARTRMVTALGAKGVSTAFGHPKRVWWLARAA
jgi:hypothetical protein